ncbi:MAG: hypothetical protein KGS45_06825 [Planctomycetes bacterium]|nr:hypothetical protein [Planctomycetota bacterium]
MKIDISSSWRVHAMGSVELSLPARTVWGQMRDVAAFLCIDPLHSRVLVEQGRHGATLRGSNVLIEHRVLGIGPDRLGRVLKFEEGRGFAVSDLSKRGVTVGFPHVCVYELEEVDATHSRIHVSARGKWTATWMPRWMVKVWLWWILRSTESMIDGYFGLFGREWRKSEKNAACRSGASRMGTE